MKTTVERFHPFAPASAGNDLSRTNLTLTAAEVTQLLACCGEKTLGIGHLEPNGSMLLPVDRVVEAFGVLANPVAPADLESRSAAGNTEAMLNSLEALVDHVCETRERRHLPTVMEVFGVKFSD